MRLLLDIALNVLFAAGVAACLALLLWWVRRPICPRCGERGHTRCTGWLPIDWTKARGDLAMISEQMDKAPVDPRSFRPEQQDPRVMAALRRMGPPS